MRCHAKCKTRNVEDFHNFFFFPHTCNTRTIARTRESGLESATVTSGRKNLKTLNFNQLSLQFYLRSCIYATENEFMWQYLQDLIQENGVSYDEVVYG